MKIERISVFQLDLPLHKPYWLQGGRLKFEVLDSTLVRIDTDTGISGWGEGCPWGSTYVPAFGGGIRAAMVELAPAVLGLDPRRLEQLSRAMDRALPGHLYAKAPLDIACWDIFGQATGLPVCDLLGGREPEPVPIASSVSTGTPETMLAEIERFRREGNRLHSCKIGSGVEADVARIRHLEANRRPGEVMFYDVNRAWRPREAIEVMNAVRDLGCWFEQPCETLDEILQVRRRTLQPISIDEGLNEFPDLVRIQREGIGEIAHIKLGRVGGLTRARRMRDFCLQMGLTMIVMETGGSVVADTTASHFAQAIPKPACLGTWSCQDMITVDPAPGQGARNRDGHFTAPDAPGLGVAPDLDVLGSPVQVFEAR